VVPTAFLLEQVRHTDGGLHLRAPVYPEGLRAMTPSPPGPPAPVIVREGLTAPPPAPATPGSVRQRPKEGIIPEQPPAPAGPSRTTTGAPIIRRTGPYTQDPALQLHKAGPRIQVHPVMPAVATVLQVPPIAGPAVPRVHRTAGPATHLADPAALLGPIAGPAALPGPTAGPAAEAHTVQEADPPPQDHPEAVPAPAHPLPEGKDTYSIRLQYPERVFVVSIDITNSTTETIMLIRNQIN